MSNWLTRGLAFAGLMVVIRLIQGVLINAWEAHAGLISTALLLLFIAAVMLWGLADGRADASANPDPDRRQDLAMTWLGAGMVAGVVSGVVSWLISQFDKALYASSLVNEVSSFAAFTALLVFVPAVGAVTIGRWLVDKGYAKLPQHHHGLAALEAGTSADVFAAVGALPAGSEAGQEAATVEFGPVATLPGEVTTWTAEELPAEAIAELPTETTEDDTPTG